MGFGCLLLTLVFSIPPDTEVPSAGQLVEVDSINGIVRPIA